MSAPGADGAQPNGTAPEGGQDPGQDPSSQYSVLGEDAFNDAPEELREHLVNYVKTKVDPALTQRFQEASEFRKTWEPYSQIEGLTDLGPEDVDALVDFGYLTVAAQDENHPNHQQAVEQLQETWEQMGEQFGFFEGGDDDDSGDGDDEPQYLTKEEFEQMMAQRDQQGQIQQTQQQIQEELREHVGKLKLPGEPGSEKRQKAEEAVYLFMQPYASRNDVTAEQMVKAAYEDYTALVGESQADLVEDVEEAGGGTTLRGGGADNQPEDFHRDWSAADKAARARLMGAR